METENTSRNEWEYGDEDDDEEDRLPEYKLKQKDMGFVMDEKSGQVKSISKLWAALQWFRKDFTERNFGKRIKAFDLVTSIKGDYIQNYSVSYKNENDGSQAQRKDITKFNICWIVKITFTSVFGIDDIRYYYVVFRKQFFNRWANTYYENAKNYFSHDGITLKVDIVNHTLPPNRDIAGISTLVLVTGDTKIYYTPMEDILYLANSKLGIFTDKWNQICVGIPKDYMKEEDVNKY